MVASLLFCIRRLRRRREIGSERRPAINVTKMRNGEPREELDAKQSILLDSQLQVELAAPHGMGELENRRSIR